jgi:hypothetical protein
LADIVVRLTNRRWATPLPIGLNNFPIVVRTDRKENTAALLLPSLQALQFQYIILIPYNFGRL